LDLAKKLTLLDEIYKIYDDAVSGWSFFCKKQCALCCTQNVTLTTLEGERIVRHIQTSGQNHLFDVVRKNTSQKRFRPETTTNRIAELCALGEEIPDETIDPASGTCPLLENDLCLVYEERPFGCRCLVSKNDCRKTGYAEIDPFILTINDIFIQHIEHLDHQGMTGNFCDIIALLQPVENQSHNIHRNASRDTLIQNRPIRVLMIPPEHRDKVRPVIESLKKILPRAVKTIKA
jgi:Fe-S-cluster containining protein